MEKIISLNNPLSCRSRKSQVAVVGFGAWPSPLFRWGGVIWRLVQQYQHLLFFIGRLSATTRDPHLSLDARTRCDD